MKKKNEEKVKHEIMYDIDETTINIVAEGTRINGKIRFDRISRVHGVLAGEVSADDGSMLILAETATVEGTIEADRLTVDGFVLGNITAKTQVIISRTGRVIGNIRTPSLKLEFGAYFEGRCNMESEASATTTLSRALKPA